MDERMTDRAASGVSRRFFIRSNVLGVSALFIRSPNSTFAKSQLLSQSISEKNSVFSQPLDLSPAKWIWYPSDRVLPNTFILFRKEFNLHADPVRAQGWILGESRYLLHANKQRIQWGPAPSDPRYTEVDPVNVSTILHKGKNVIGATVCFFGHGDGTWAIGKPGFIFKLEIELADGSRQDIVSDHSWRSHLARCWQPGHYKRWLLRSLQEEFDARLYPDGWLDPDFDTDKNWLEPMEIKCPADKPVVCADMRDYINDSMGDPKMCYIRPRSIPLVKESRIPVIGLSETMWITWKRPCYEYFESLTPDSYEVDRTPAGKELNAGRWTVQFDHNKGQGAVLTFELPEEIVGFPYFTIDAPQGTIVELMFREAHTKGGPAFLNTFFNSWARFVCQEGENRFETFDYEGLRWISLHIHNTDGAVTITDVGARRRTYDWTNEPEIDCSDTVIQKVLNACVNTIKNSSIEINSGDAARERQQYSGDCGHQTLAQYSAFGDHRLAGRYITTYGEGMTVDGYFMDCWPGVDRLVRVGQRQINLTNWGPILDHGVQFNFDCFYYYLYTGDIRPLEQVYAKLLRFVQYLKSIQQSDDLLPAVDIGVPSVWMDHIGFKKEKHKQCSFNLHASSMMLYALGPICRIFNDSSWEKSVTEFGHELLKNTLRHFWSSKHGLFVDNLPWADQEGEIRTHDRTLATSILYDQCPHNNTYAALQCLKTTPPEMGLSYPPNAGWRLLALAKAGEIDTVIDELRHRWGTMESIHENNTMSENWHSKPDTRNQYSHCSVAPLYVLYMGIVGLVPLDGGLEKFQLRPQLGDLGSLKLVIQTIKGPMPFETRGPKGNRDIFFSVPPSCSGELVLSEKEKVDLPAISGKNPRGTKRYRLDENKHYTLKLHHT